jgi:nitrate reductase (cytochrome), electron transfer subunit
VIALTVGLSGFFMGLRQTGRSLEAQREQWMSTPVQEAHPDAHSAIIHDDTISAAPAVDYAQLGERSLHANRGWVNSLANLAPPSSPQTGYAFLSADEQQLVRRQRASRRLFDGAPPTAPHPLDQLSPAACLACHGKPTMISGVLVPRMSHPLHKNCLQCHVSSVGPTSSWRSHPVSLADGNQFTGTTASGYGSRAYTGAPPVVSHTTWMRQDCMSCHGPGGTAAFRTSHPERQNCLQCHAVDARAEQSPILARTSIGSSALPPPLPASLKREVGTPP